MMADYIHLQMETAVYLYGHGARQPPLPSVELGHRHTNVPRSPARADVKVIDKRP